MMNLADVSELLQQSRLRTVEPAVIHLVGRMTDDVFSFLGPLTETLGSKGIAQVVILRDEPAFKHLQSRFDPSIGMVLLPSTSSLVRQVRDMARALSQHAIQSTVVYCHLHGVIPSLVGAWVYRRKRLSAKLLFSPHGSRSLKPVKLVRRVIVKLLKAVMPNDAIVPVANNKLDARKIARLTYAAVPVIESPVHHVFFNTPAREADKPQVVAGAGLPDRLAAAHLAQLAVLFWDESVDVQFAWYGPLTSDSRAKLKAAGVTVFETLGEAERATKMANAWIYLSLGNDEGFPSLLAEAMALGLPCLGWGATTSHEFLRHGVTGLVANDQASVLESMALLVRSPDMRKQLGAAARNDAVIRFDRRRFDRAILGIYGHASAS